MTSARGMASAAAEAVGLHVVVADRREPYPQQHPTARLAVEAVRSGR